MKISQIIDEEIDQNEIESNYLWCYTAKEMKRINLSSCTIDFSSKFRNDCKIIPRMAIPNNKIYGIESKPHDQSFQYQWIIDKGFNKKIRGKSSKVNKSFNHAAICYYDESIFIFEGALDIADDSIYYSSKRYLISQDKWINLCPSPFKTPDTCVGFNQKILIAEATHGLYNIWLYDIILNSYTCNGIFESKLGMKDYLATFIKSKGKICLILISMEFYYEVYSIASETSLINIDVRLERFNIKIKINCQHKAGKIKFLNFLYLVEG